jgi:hypothetical protein
MYRRLVRLLLLLPLLCWLLLVTHSRPASAAIAQPDLIPLTLEVLQQRLKSPIQSEGLRVVDLQRVMIDLRPENGEFRDRFYELVRTQLQRPGTPVGLDLSYSQIQGEFKISQLGLRAPLFGQALSPIFSPTEQTQLQRDRRLLSRLSTLSQSLLATPNLGNQDAPLQITVFRGPLKLNQTRFLGLTDFSNTFFLNRVEAQGAQFTQGVDSSQARFSQIANFAGALFGRDARFRSSIFFSKAEFTQAQFQAPVTFQNSEFQATANFNQAIFQQTANFMRVQWQGNADFAQVLWVEDVVFTKGSFNKALFLPDAIFEQGVMFRQVQFNNPVNMRGTSILQLADFSDAGFGAKAYLNVSGLKFDSDQAKIVGDPGQIGRYITVPSLEGNENLLRELVRNFRRQEQIPDANQLDYTRQRLRLRDLRQQLFGININTATVLQLRRLGFSATQADTIAKRRTERPFRSLTDLLSLANVDIATYINVRDRIVAKSPNPPGLAIINRIATGIAYISLSLLLLLSHYGTRSWLILGVGLITIAYFGFLFWLIDRVRRLTPKPILPDFNEIFWILSGFSILFLLGMLAVFRNSDQPWATLASLAAIDIPVPTVLIALLYKAGRYHPLMDVSYFMEEGTLRQLRILVGRLPIIPRYQMFRERYVPILWDRRWTWLNYFDFSFNNLLRFGFNDIRLRDEYVPGLITALVWYQWAIGILYLGLLFWTLSRTIPGLNLLIYFK